MTDPLNSATPYATFAAVVAQRQAYINSPQYIADIQARVTANMAGRIADLKAAIISHVADIQANVAPTPLIYNTDGISAAAITIIVTKLEALGYSPVMNGTWLNLGI
jgi:hypothetical protein